MMIYKSIGINKIKCPYCGAKTYHKDNDFTQTKVGDKIFCLACEERYTINKIFNFLGRAFIITVGQK